jgi:hypothetical protein
LQGFLTARAGRQAEEAASKAGQMEEEYAQRMLGRMQGGYTPDTTAMERIAREGQRTPEQIAASMPAETTLAEVTPTSRYVKSPEEALNMASTSVGTAALKNRPFMAARLAEMLKTPAAEEFGTTPVKGKGGKFYLASKSGKLIETDVEAPDETLAPTPLARLIAERDALPPNDPRIPTYDAAINAETQGKGTRVDVRYGAPVAGVDAQGNPVFFQPNPTGGPPSVIAGVRPEGKAPTESQMTARLYADRMAQAEPVFANPPPSFGSRFKEGLPGGVGNVMLTPESRQFFQAERNFINAVLRKESGAVISDAEFENARRQYVPQPGDDANTLEQKRRNRALAIQQIGAAGGSNYAPPNVGGSQIIDLPPRR